MRPTEATVWKKKGQTVLRKSRPVFDFLYPLTKGAVCPFSSLPSAQVWQNRGQIATKKEQKIENILEKNLSFQKENQKMYADKNRKTSAVCLTVFVSPLNMKCLDRNKQNQSKQPHKNYVCLYYTPFSILFYSHKSHKINIRAVFEVTFLQT